MQPGTGGPYTGPGRIPSISLPSQRPRSGLATIGGSLIKLDGVVQWTMLSRMTKKSGLDIAPQAAPIEPAAAASRATDATSIGLRKNWCQNKPKRYKT